MILDSSRRCVEVPVFFPRNQHEQSNTTYDSKGRTVIEYDRMADLGRKLRRYIRLNSKSAKPFLLDLHRSHPQNPP